MRNYPKHSSQWSAWSCSKHPEHIPKAIQGSVQCRQRLIPARTTRGTGRTISYLGRGGCFAQLWRPGTRPIPATRYLSITCERCAIIVYESRVPIDICLRRCHPTYRPMRWRGSSVFKSAGSSSSSSGGSSKTPKDRSS